MARDACSLHYSFTVFRTLALADLTVLQPTGQLLDAQTPGHCRLSRLTTHSAFPPLSAPASLSKGEAYTGLPMYPVLGPGSPPTERAFCQFVCPTVVLIFWTRLLKVLCAYCPTHLLTLP